MATVLFINDRTCTSQITIQRLRACGYAVELAIDADEAVRLLRLHPIDAVVMDCHIEASSPTDVLAALRSTSANIPIVMMSGYCGVPCKVLRYADLCIQKGDFKLLSSTLRTLLCSRHYGLLRSVAA
jgi:DNA-binding NtrC family response regulator